MIIMNSSDRFCHSCMRCCRVLMPYIAIVVVPAVFLPVHYFPVHYRHVTSLLCDDLEHLSNGHVPVDFMHVRTLNSS